MQTEKRPAYVVPMLEEFHSLEDFLSCPEKPAGVPLWATAISLGHCQAIVHALMSSVDDEDNRLCMNDEHIYNALHLLENQLELISKAINIGQEGAINVS